MQVLKREVMRTQESDMDKSDEYRHLLVGAINTCATKFPDVAENVVQVLLDFLAGAGGHDIMLFTRTILEQYPHLREVIMRKICSNFDDISTASALRVALWVIGEYGSTEELLTTCVEEVMRNLGQPPFVEENKDGASATEVNVLCHLVTCSSLAAGSD
jgi:coatomer subunit beta